MIKFFQRTFVLIVLQIIVVNSNAQPLINEFLNPPESAKPWVFWFWSNGNLSKAGITADLEAMKRVGIGGVIIMEVDKQVPKGAYAFGSPEWRELFKFMVQEANRLGLKVNMNNDAGWCGSGGPWIPVEKSMQKIVWSETIAQGSSQFNFKLPQPEAVNNYYEDIMVLAFPTPEGDDKQVSDYNPEVKVSTAGLNLDGKKLIDKDENSHMELSKPTPDNPHVIDIIFPKLFTSRFLTIHLMKNRWTLNGVVQVSNDGEHYQNVKEFNEEAPIISIEFNEQTASRYRLIFKQVTKSEQPLDKVIISEVHLSNTRINGIEQKSMLLPHPNLNKNSNLTIVPANFQSLESKYTVSPNQVLNITDKMKSDGSISWTKPQGKWTVLRLGHTTTGRTNFTGPESGVGYECDKLSKDASTIFFNGLIAKLVSDSKEHVGKTFISTHIDSWEIGSQNWTPGLSEEFKKRRGYDPVSYLPAVIGVIVGNRETTERFLWDLRKTISEMMLENYTENISSLAHQNGLKLSIEAYNKCLTDELTYAGRADVPMAEFWSHGKKYEFDFSCTEMSSAAHVYGKKIIGAEAFTSTNQEAWLDHPGNIKEMGDWAFCEGVNRFVFHRYAMQPYQNIKPGISMGPTGLHYESTQTWWEQSAAWHKYLARCQYLLQQGLFVADICYIASELTPQTWKSPYKRDSTRYKFDACPPEVVLTRMSVKDGLVVLPDGMNYKLLVMPSTETMTPKLLIKIKELVAAGATLVGAPPKKALGLTNYPQSDKEVQKLTAELWGKCDGLTVKENRFGKGRVINGKTPEEVLAEMKIERDFSSGEFLRFIHKAIDGTEVYFIANPAKYPVNTVCQFRVQGMQPQLWDPMTGKTKKAAQYKESKGKITMSISLEAEGSVFVVFQPEYKPSIAVTKLLRNGQEQNIDIVQNEKNEFEFAIEQPGNYKLIDSEGKDYAFEVKDIAQPLMLKGPWEVQFIHGMGAPAKTTFQELISWSNHQDPNIKYYSGSAIYSKNISISKELIGKNKLLKLDLGKVAVIAEVKVNGKSVGILWKSPFEIDITDAIKIGDNTIEIKVVNLWVNRMIGDEQLPDDSKRSPQGALLEWPQWVINGQPNPTERHTFTTFKLWKKGSPLLESGLIGPVRIIQPLRVNLPR